MNVQTDRDMFVSQDGPGYGFNQIDTTDSLGAINASGSMTGNYLFSQSVLTSKAGVESLGKRQFDLVLGGLILLLASPVILLTGALIWLSSMGRDPVFYRQLRVGLKGREFYVWKFRSMRTDAERNGAQMAAKNDSRVTRIGRFIRKTRIDELPQLWNVFIGDMSLVGPRPERPEFVYKFQRKIRGYALRHQVKPGITGWAQVKYPYGETVEDAAHKLYYDLTYVRKNSVLFDLMVLLRTIPVILTGHGAR
ncbi:MAG: exopolysaccharide biosynthesis polyprenyl glycosylphosphotransferase [Candidatus Thiodiazotropha sp. 'RUGA']|nr:exopolysaccharide biosynthesis polyprenyl glycosylphosphotransferase [Candidatus Thiodiazotropha sp. 'RUGA']